MKVLYTYLYKDSYWEPFWREYYSPFFDTIIDYQLETDKKFDDEHVARMFNKEIANLLKGGNTVMRVDVDEIVVPNPEKYKDLGDYLDKFKGQAVCCTGYHLIEMPYDKKLDIKKKLTDQRRYWVRDSVYDKAVITKIPLKYFPGFHKTIQNVSRDEDLAMFHLRDANLEETSKLFEKYRKAGFSIGEFKKRQKEAILIPYRWRVI